LKKAMILAVVIVNLFIFNQPANAVPNENADSRAFLAQEISECRIKMNAKVVSGEMTKEELKQCIADMKNGQCHNEEVCTK